MIALERFAFLTCSVLGVTPARLDEIRRRRERNHQVVSAEETLRYRMRYGWPVG